MPAVYLVVFLVLAALGLSAAPALAQDPARRGVDVFDAFCAECHVDGAKGAPKIGDQADWARRAAQGPAALTQHAIYGIRNMPPHNGTKGLNDLEIRRAIVYMVNESGGKWPEPVGTRGPARERSGAQVARAHCAQCHDGGLNGAPLTGDQNAWANLFARRGVDNLVRAVAKGHGDMPARGGDAALTDAEMRSATIYMAGSEAARTASDRRAGLTAPVSSLEKAAGDLRIIFALTPARALRSFPDGAGRNARDVYLVNVVLLDRRNNAPVTGALVEARVEPQGPGAKAGEVQLVPIGTASYAAYVKLAPRTHYGLIVRVRPPGGAPKVEAKFERAI
jgi:cytochrome c5